MEFDCARIAERTLWTNYYAGNNLTGDERVDDTQSGWSPEMPGTTGDQIITAVCNRMKPH